MSKDSDDKQKPVDPMKEAARDMEAAERAAKTAEQDALQTLRDYALPVGIGVVLALVLYFGYTGWQYSQRKTAEKVASQFAQADTMEELQQIVEEHPKSSVAPMALIGLGSQQFHNGQYESAMASYEQFATNFPGHLLRPAADLGQAYCMEGLGRVSESLSRYEAFIDAHPDHYMLPMAVFGKARSMEQLGRVDEAKDVYESFIVDFPDSQWLAHAQSALRYLEMQVRANG